MIRFTPACLLMLLLAGCASAPRLTELGSWEVALTPPRNTPPDPNTRWSADTERDGVSDLWMRSRLPSPLPSEPHVVLRSFASTLALFAGDTPVYAHHDPSQQGRLRLHVFALDERASGAWLYVRVPEAAEGTLFGASPLLVARRDVPAAISEIAFASLRQDISDIAIALLLVGVAVIALFASGVSRHADVQALRLFGVFTLLYGVRLLTDSYLPVTLGVALRTASMLTAVITYVITVPAWLLAVHLIGPGWKSTLRWQVLVFALFAPVGIVSDFVTGNPGSLESVVNVLVIIGGVNILANLLLSQKRTTIELHVILAGTIAFMLFALNNNLSALGLLPWNSVDETPGFLLFAASLGFAATRAFVRGEREGVAIAKELETAREIQRSILPADMPLLEGVRIHAGYVPASSVGGDLYDFLQVDSRHCGVLVADVAGHGVPAALVASMVKIAVSSQLHLARDPGAMLGELNRTLRREVRRAFVTATCLSINMDAREITVSNGGHLPPLLLRNGAFAELGGYGVLLGRFAGTRWTGTVTSVQSGDRVIAITDGIVESRSRRDELFGDERLRAILLETAGLEARDVTDVVLARAQDWRGAQNEDADDLTIVVIDIL